MGISETHWTGQGKIQIDDGMSIIYSGRDDEIHREGVAIMLTKEAGDGYHRLGTNKREDY